MLYIYTVSDARWQYRNLIAWGALRIVHLVCTIHTMNSADLIAKLKKAGWTLRAVKGSHHVYTHPGTGAHLTVPHPKKDLGVGLVQKLLKQAGLK